MEVQIGRSTITVGQGDAFSGNVGTIHGGVHHYHGITGLDGTPTEKLKSKIDEWLQSCCVDFASSHDAACKLRTPKTGAWFRESAIFQRWCDGETKHLACQGMPGGGKTVMASTVIDHLKEQHKGAPNVVLYAYIRYDQRSTHTLQKFFASLLSQVTKHQHVVFEDVLTLYEEYTYRQPPIPTAEKLIAAVRAVIAQRQYAKVFIIVDALDEWNPINDAYDSAYDLIRELEDLVDIAQLLITSRYDVPYTPGTFERLPIRAMPEDIRIFVSNRLRRGLLRRVKSSPALEKQVCEKIEAKADGMFIIARLLAESISRMQSVGAILKTLDTFPGGLDAAYALTMDRILEQDPEEVKLAISVFSWMIYFPDITGEQLQHALATDSEVVGDIEDNFPEEGYLTTICGGLIVVNRTGRSSSSPWCFEFVHFTTQEFLHKTAQKYFPLAQRYLAESCLRYLSFVLSHILPSDVAHLRCCPDPLCDIRRNSGPFILFTYAIGSWHRHARGAKYDFDRSLVFQLFRHPSSTYVMRPISSSGYPAILDLPPESYMTLFFAGWGFKLLLEKHLDECVDQQSLLNCTDRHGRSPLSLAAEEGDADIVKLLLDKGADPERADDAGRTPISYAAWRDNVIPLLLDRAVNVDKADDDGYTALSYAAQQGNPEAVALLLKGGASLDHQTKDGRSPLSFAAAQGELSGVKHLLEAGADPGLADKKGRTPLYYALCYDNESDIGPTGYMSTIRALLDKGADPNMKDESGDTPLKRMRRNGLMPEDVKAIVENYAAGGEGTSS